MDAIDRLGMTMSLMLAASPLVRGEAEESAKPESEAEELTETVVWGTRVVGRDALTRPATEPIGLETATAEVTPEDLLRQNPATLTEALNFAPGAWTETRGRKVKQFTSFRGQTYPYPDYAVDGMWFREFYELPYFFPASEIERVQIVRSSAALMTGLSGLSGVVNIVPKREAGRTTRLESEFGTDDYQRYYFSHSEPIPNGSILVSAGHQSTNGEKNLNAAETINTGSIRLNWSPDPTVEWDTFLFVLDGSRELKRAQDPAGKGVKRRLEEFDPIESVLFGTRVRYHHGEIATTEFSAWGSDRKARFIDRVNGIEHDDDDYEYGVQLLQSFVPLEGNILRVGALYHRWVAPDGKRFYAGNRNDIETVSAVIVDQHDFGDLKLDLGYRYSREYLNDYAAFNIEGSGNDFLTVAPIQDEWAEPLHRVNFGGSYKFDPCISIYANYSYGGLDAPTGALDPGGEPVGREARHMVDAGLVFDTDSLGVLKTGLFGVYRDDGIHLTADTYLNPIGLEVPVYENRNSRQFGFEAEWRSPWYWDRVSLFSSAQLLMSEVEDDAGSYHEDREVPKQIYAAGIYFREGKFDASFFGKHVSDYENDRFSSTGPQPLGDYTDLNLTAGYTFEGPIKARAFIALNNLLDDDYSSVVGYYDRGLRFSVGLQGVF